MDPDELRLRAGQRLPRVLFDYLDGGASAEVTSGRNTSDFNRIQLRQRVLVDVTTRSSVCGFLGRDRAAPIVLGPVGFVGAFRRDGEVLAARAAHKYGVPYCLSMFSISSLTELRRSTSGEIWMQVYVTKDRRISEMVMNTAKSLGVDTICITVDTPAGAIRERDVRSGMRGASSLTPKILRSLLAKPGWCLNMAPKGMPRFGNLHGLPELGSNAFVQSARLARQIDSALNWEELKILRSNWSGKLILKGVLDPEDARRACEIGVDAVVVSNHGGRQLDSVPSTISSVQRIAAALGPGCEVALDGGVRRGLDVAKALALGAKSVWIGRAYAYALAVDGQAGVERLIASMLEELDSALAHVGQPFAADLSPANIAAVSAWSAGHHADRGGPLNP